MNGKGSGEEVAGIVMENGVMNMRKVNAEGFVYDLWLLRGPNTMSSFYNHFEPLEIIPAFMKLHQINDVCMHVYPITYSKTEIS